MKKTLLALIVGSAMIIPSFALADISSSCSAYKKHCTSNTTTTTSTPTTSTGTTTPSTPSTTEATTAAKSQSTLPFTGLDLVALLAGGSVLLGAGLVVRRLSRDPDSN